ncbi:TetR/AcrR family transcriptional regulator [Cellulomonas marina]|uniref:TetR/AcrR family transcriptional regulator n=1 Tax=Cellulomonas marina TaxID=988821 RepID=UPI001587D0F4|nr:TetR/AcrR family transcriptional regulator [Cellulomonas marina]
MTTDVTEAPPGRAPSSVARRILDAATPLLYAHGLRAVSADRVIAAAGVSKVTFYRHFPTKDALVAAYLESWLAREQEATAALLAEHPDPVEALDALGRALADQPCAPGYRGCAFVHAASELPDEVHPARAVVTRHRDGWTAAVADLLGRAGAGDADDVARRLLVVRDGMLVAGDAAAAAGTAAAGLAVWRAVVAGALGGRAT